MGRRSRQPQHKLQRKITGSCLVERGEGGLKSEGQDPILERKPKKVWGGDRSLCATEGPNIRSVPSPFFTFSSVSISQESGKEFYVFGANLTRFGESLGDRGGGGKEFFRQVFSTTRAAGERKKSFWIQQASSR